jgi:hypothetical protein
MTGEPDEGDLRVPSVSSEPSEKMVFLQEQMVNFLRQYQMPVVEVSLVLAKYTRSLTEELERHAEQHGESVPVILREPWPLLGFDEDGNKASSDFDLGRLLDNLDEDRMDIFDTVLRTAIHQQELVLADALMQLRQWEHLARGQLADVTSPGQLYSPLDVPDEW